MWILLVLSMQQIIVFCDRWQMLIHRRNARLKNRRFAQPHLFDSEPFTPNPCKCECMWVWACLCVRCWWFGGSFVNMFVHNSPETDKCRVLMDMAFANNCPLIISTSFWSQNNALFHTTHVITFIRIAFHTSQHIYRHKLMPSTVLVVLVLLLPNVEIRNGLLLPVLKKTPTLFVLSFAMALHAIQPEWS